MSIDDNNSCIHRIRGSESLGLDAKFLYHFSYKLLDFQVCHHRENLDCIYCIILLLLLNFIFLGVLYITKLYAYIILSLQPAKGQRV